MWHACKYNPDGPNLQVPHTCIDERAMDGTRPPGTNNSMAPGPFGGGSNIGAHPPTGIPTGTGVPTSSLAVENVLHIIHERGNKSVKRGARSGRGNANGRGGRILGGRLPPPVKQYLKPMSKNAGKMAAILPGKMPHQTN